MGNWTGGHQWILIARAVYIIQSLVIVNELHNLFSFKYIKQYNNTHAKANTRLRE